MSATLTAPPAPRQWRPTGQSVTGENYEAEIVRDGEQYGVTLVYGDGGKTRVTVACKSAREAFILADDWAVQCRVWNDLGGPLTRLRLPEPREVRL